MPLNSIWWHRLTILALLKLRVDNSEFQVILKFTVRPCLEHMHARAFGHTHTLSWFSHLKIHTSISKHKPIFLSDCIIIHFQMLL